ncbi:hypothetical protein B0G76_0240 [Paraburkholderia sp. BL23I1N1]|uniref:hypothetical protein n=1 Tax=Paraburkholderia sp. BL23I1N1 TaxID=1938802 RepID=UPI000E70C18A|nr:hypothetical protein [Paraburkholderia sp. BL23I1N1]RKE34244.1 hypothetical protein B0G76_0240 [Paraburkholderia sp. BL23I1N1]
MKRIDNGQERIIPYCRAFKEDLEEIIDFMTVNGDPPKITSGDFEFENADDLFRFLGERGKPDITIRRPSAPAVNLTTVLESVQVKALDSSDPSIALLHRVSEVLSRCSGYVPGRGLINLLRGALAGTLTYFALHLKTTWLSLTFVALAAVVAFAFPRQTFAGPRIENRFYGVSRDTHKSFWQRKGDDLIVSLLSGIVGAILGALLGVAGTLFVQAHTATSPQNSGAHSSATISAGRPNSG